MSSTSSHWMPNSYGVYRKAEDVEVRFYDMVNAHIARGRYKHRAINFCVSKIKEKRKKKEIKKKNSLHPESIAVHLAEEAVPLRYVNIRCRTRKK